MNQQVTLNLTNEGAFGPWAQNLVSAGKGILAIPSVNYKDRNFVTANQDVVADVFVYSYIKKNLKAHLTKYTDDVKFLTPATGADELTQSVRESVSRGFAAYTLHPENTPEKLRNEIAKLAESTHKIALTYIQNQLKDINNFILDMRAAVDEFPDFETAVNQINDGDKVKFNLAANNIKNGELSTKPDNTFPARGFENE
ncbi:MAG: hypothetical protein LBJ73_03860 [Rickettsiales bacterium]|jgi:hypothetical protein|nr:hypothetical protein [Rickettsiales bacterium]